MEKKQNLQFQSKACFTCKSVAAVCINNYLFNADFAFIFISGTCYTNTVDTNDTHLQIVLIITDGQQIHQTCNGKTVLLGLSMMVERIL